MATRIGSRIPGSVMRSVSLVLLVSAAALGGEPLSLPQAIAMALKSNPLVAASEAGEKEAEARIRQARSGYMPRVNFSESVQRSNNPVFVFGSLLTQHQFTTDNFALGPLIQIEDQRERREQQHRHHDDEPHAEAEPDGSLVVGHSGFGILPARADGMPGAKDQVVARRSLTVRIRRGTRIKRIKRIGRI